MTTDKEEEDDQAGDQDCETGPEVHVHKVPSSEGNIDRLVVLEFGGWDLQTKTSVEAVGDARIEVGKLHGQSVSASVVARSFDVFGSVCGRADTSGVSKVVDSINGLLIVFPCLHLAVQLQFLEDLEKLAGKSFAVEVLGNAETVHLCDGVIPFPQNVAG